MTRMMAAVSSVGVAAVPLLSSRTRAPVSVRRSGEINSSSSSCFSSSRASRISRRVPFLHSSTPAPPGRPSAVASRPASRRRGGYHACSTAVRADESFLYTFDEMEKIEDEEIHKAPVMGREEEEFLYMTMLTGDLAGDAQAAEAALEEAKSEAAVAAMALQLATAGVAAAESRLREGVAAAAQEAKSAADALFAAEAKVAVAETRLGKLESRMRQIGAQLAAAEAATAQAAEAAAEKKRKEEEEEEEKERVQAFDAAVAAAAAEEATAAAKAKAANFADANFPMDAEGHVYHLGGAVQLLNAVDP
jgi:hypothetical protein